MGFFDQLASAFENDDTLGERQDAGLKQRIQYQTITWQGPPPEGMAGLFEKPPVTEQQAIPGQLLKDLAADAGVPLKFSCMQGTCGICDVTVNGQVVPACTAKMPKNDVTIEYKSSAAAEAYMKEKMKAQRAAKKAAKAAGEAAPMSGKVKPTKAPGSVFGGGPGRVGNPFEGAGGNPFAGFDPFGGSKDDVDDDAGLTELEKRLKAENAAKKATKGGGWPFGS